VTPVSNHAVDRWCERFTGEDMGAAFARAVRVPFARLLRWCQESHKRWDLRPSHEYYHDEACDAIFVVAMGNSEPIIRTVFRFGRVKKAAR